MFAYVKFKIESGFYAEFINELIERQIYIKNIRYNDLTVTAVCKARDYKEVVKLGKKFGCRVRKIKKYGFYYEIKPILNRKGIVAAAIIFVLLTIVYDQTVWKININTDNEELKNAVMNQMIENEVFIGKFYNKEKFEQTAKKIVQNCNGVGYATLNFYRGILNCNIYTSIKAEEYIKDQTNDVILANADGIIKDIRVYRGYSDYKAGDTVCKGDVLVTNFHEKSGVFSPTRAYITAISHKNYQVYVPYERDVYIYDGNYENKNYYFLSIDDCVNHSVSVPEEYSAYQKISQVNIMGFLFPIIKKSITVYSKIPTHISYDENGALQNAKTQIEHLITADKKLLEETNREYFYNFDKEGVYVTCTVYGCYNII